MITARRLEDRDLELRVQWLNSPAIHGRMMVDAPLSLSGTRKWFATAALDPARRDYTFLADVDGETRPVGMGGLTAIDHRHRNAELYIFVAPDRAGQGYGTAAVRWMCNHGFLALDLTRVYLHTLDRNQAARRVYERCGFTAEGVLRQATRHGGRWADRHVHAILREEWQAADWAARDLADLAG